MTPPSPQVPLALLIPQAPLVSPALPASLAMLTPPAPRDEADDEEEPPRAHVCHLHSRYCAIYHCARRSFRESIPPTRYPLGHGELAIVYKRAIWALDPQTLISRGI